MLWLFTVDQAAKATEGEALGKIKAAGKKILVASGKLRFSLRLSFAPTGGTSSTQPFGGNLMETLKPAPR